jgi:signal peptidase
LTKGDNNLIDDRTMYPDGQDYLPRSQILGFVRGYIPFMGWIVIVIQEPTRVLEAAIVLFRAVGLVN